MVQLKVSPKHALKQKLILRRPPDAFLELLTKPSSELESIVKRIESHPLFHQLVSMGVVRKVCYKSLATWKVIKECDMRWLSDFLRKHIEWRSGWQSDLLSQDALKRVDELARKYGVTATQLKKAITLLKKLLANSEEKHEHLQSESQVEDEEGRDVDLPSVNSLYVDLSEDIVAIQRFVELYGISECDFLKFYEGEMSPSELCSRYGCKMADVMHLLEHIKRVQVHEIFAEASIAPVRSSVASSGEIQFEVVARASVDAGGALSIQFLNEHLYATRYVIDEERLKAFARSHHNEELNHLINLLRYINRWHSLLGRLVWTVCYHQRRFILTGDEALLKPLPQAEVARELGHHRSHICRAIRHRGISTPHGKYPLSFLCASKEQVILSVAKRYPHWTDQQISDFIFMMHGCRVPRRTVSYHRSKVRRASNC
ncbi:MAG: hypothetical protein RUDDFDWM_001717 [Candidatus Fervidibacterota bacterium]